MTKTLDGMIGCERCPICHKAPTEKVYESPITGELLIELICEDHKYFIAMGRTLEDAARHFNVIVHFYQAGGFQAVA